MLASVHVHFQVLSTRRSSVELAEPHRIERDVWVGGDSQIERTAHKSLILRYQVHIQRSRKRVRESGRQSREVRRERSRYRATSSKVPFIQQFSNIDMRRQPELPVGTVTKNKYVQNF